MRTSWIITDVISARCHLQKFLRSNNLFHIGALGHSIWRSWSLFSYLWKILVRSISFPSAFVPNNSPFGAVTPLNSYDLTPLTEQRLTLHQQRVNNEDKTKNPKFMEICQIYTSNIFILFKAKLSIWSAAWFLMTIKNPALNFVFKSSLISWFQLVLGLSTISSVLFLMRPWNKASICSLRPLQALEFQNKQKLNFVKIKIPMRWWWQALQTWSEPQICFDWENMQSQALPVPSMHSNVISQFVTLLENFLQNIHGCFHKHKQ